MRAPEFLDASVLSCKARLQPMVQQAGLRDAKTMEPDCVTGYIGMVPYTSVLGG